MTVSVVIRRAMNPNYQCNIHKNRILDSDWLMAVKLKREEHCQAEVVLVYWSGGSYSTSSIIQVFTDVFHETLLKSNRTIILVQFWINMHLPRFRVI